MGSEKTTREPGTETDAPSSEETSSEEQFRCQCLGHLPALYGTAVRLVRNKSDAEDLVQETYLKAVRSSESLDPKSDCKAWLFKIMTNTFIDQYRRSTRTPQLVELDEEDERGLEDRRAEPEAAVFANLMDEDVQRALDALPERNRMPILLFDVEGFTYAEIADMLNIPVGTVMSRLYRGRRMLKRALMDYARKQGYAE